MAYAASHLSLAALEGAAEDFVPVLAGVSDSHRLAAIAAEVFVCETAAELVERARGDWTASVRRALYRTLGRL